MSDISTIKLVIPLVIPILKLILIEWSSPAITHKKKNETFEDGYFCTFTLYEYSTVLRFGGFAIIMRKIAQTYSTGRLSAKQKSVISRAETTILLVVGGTGLH